MGGSAVTLSSMTASTRTTRLAAALAVALLAGVAAASALAARPRPRTLSHRVAMTSLERGVLQDINAFRRAHHLRPLRVSGGLTRAARRHSEEMAARGYFAHESASGAAFWRRIQQSYGSSNWSLWSVGENLLWSSPGVSASRALRMWEHSPEHLKNLLTPRWREIGVSAVHVSSAPGVYHGLGVTIVTTDFGVRR
jgi:uncharacterized protein YkwD